MEYFFGYIVISSNSILAIMKWNRNGISLFFETENCFFETENHWPYVMQTVNNNRGTVAQRLECMTDSRKILGSNTAGASSELCQCLSEETVKAIGPSIWCLFQRK